MMAYPICGPALGGDLPAHCLQQTSSVYTAWPTTCSIEPVSLSCIAMPGKTRRGTEVKPHTHKERGKNRSATFSCSRARARCVTSAAASPGQNAGTGCGS